MAVVQAGQCFQPVPNVHDLSNGSMGEFNGCAIRGNSRPVGLRDRLEALSYRVSPLKAAWPRRNP